MIFAHQLNKQLTIAEPPKILVLRYADKVKPISHSNTLFYGSS